jgi:hypothetical protein
MATLRNLFIVVAPLALEGALLPGALQAQAPRESAEVSFGPIKVSVDHGCPAWNEQRLAQLKEQVPVGALWRMGADDHTTILVAGGAIRLGDLVIDDGGFGLNARRTGEREWNFVLYDGGEATAETEDNKWETPATFTERQDPAPERLAFTISDEKVGATAVKVLSVRFGPMVLSAPIVPVEARDGEVKLGGEIANARWFAVTAANAPRAGAWVRTGETRSFFVGDVNCAFDVDLKLDEKGAAVRFRNRARAKVADEIAGLNAQLARVKKEPAGGHRAEREVIELEATLEKLAEELKDVGPAPEPFELAVPLTAAKTPSGKISAELVSKGGKLELVVQANDRAGSVAVDEAKLLPPKSPKAGDKN